MIFPEKLFQLLVRDAGNVGPRWFASGQITATALSTVVTASWTNDTKQILIVGTLAATYIPGAGQNYASTQWRIRDAAGNIMCDVADNDTASGAGASAFKSFNVGGAVWLPPRFQLSCNGRFNAGANSNEVDAFLHGVLVPAGSLLMA